nr:MAG TPA: hypothetical protein [Caudoviricetes sp.]DAU94551.1 MAG TPA: hypothetical protein [Caudoviricetes sp.]
MLLSQMQIIVILLLQMGLLLHGLPERMYLHSLSKLKMLQSQPIQ